MYLSVIHYTRYVRTPATGVYISRPFFFSFFFSFFLFSSFSPRGYSLIVVVVFCDSVS